MPGCRANHQMQQRSEKEIDSPYRHDVFMQIVHVPAFQAQGVIRFALHAAACISGLRGAVPTHLLKRKC